jgi:hypothetical protein
MAWEAARNSRSIYHGCQEQSSYANAAARLSYRVAHDGIEEELMTIQSISPRAPVSRNNIHSRQLVERKKKKKDAAATPPFQYHNAPLAWATGTIDQGNLKQPEEQPSFVQDGREGGRRCPTHGQTMVMPAW